METSRLWGGAGQAMGNGEAGSTVCMESFRLVPLGALSGSGVGGGDGGWGG